MPHVANPPILLESVFDDVAPVVDMLYRNAPYRPLGGWFRPDSGEGAALSPMWFQQDWVHAGQQVDGAERFINHDRMLDAARSFYDAELVLPHTLYVNLFCAIAECGPAHTDNPVFRGRDRTNTPMLLLRVMYWSGLFEPWEITQATSIWWLNDVPGGGGLRYWPDGPDAPPQRHVGNMANTALVGDNHGMFHQVEAVPPHDDGTVLVNAEAELAPVGDGDAWAVTYRGEEQFRSEFAGWRVSVLMKADVYADAAEKQRVDADLLSLDEVARVFNADLAQKGADLRVDAAALGDPALPGQLSVFYPEPVPVQAGRSFFDMPR